MQQNTLCEQIGIRDIKIQRVILQRWLNRTLSKMAMRADTNFLVTIFSVKGLRHKDMLLYIQRWGNRSERGRGAILHSIAIRHAWSSITRAWLWAQRKWLVLHMFAFSHNVAHKYESKFRHPSWRKLRQYATTWFDCQLSLDCDSNVILAQFKIYTRSRQ